MEVANAANVVPVYEFEADQYIGKDIQGRHG
jgi:hypothetical protein